MKKYLKLLIVLIVPLFLLVSCNFSTKGKEVQVEISVSKTMEIGQKYKVSASLSNGEADEFIYTASNDCVKIEADLITPVKDGKFTLTATSKTNSSYTASVEITVNKKVEPVKTTYTCEYYFEELDGSFRVESEEISVANFTDNRIGEIKNINGFKFDENNPNNVLEGSAQNDFVFKVYYIRETYKIIYIIDSENKITATYKYEEPIKVIDNPAFVPYGYEFGMWSKELPKNMPNEDITVNAILNPKTIVIHFDSNGGSSCSDMTVKYGQSPSLPTPTKDGYIFDGWKLNGFSFEAITMPDKDFTLVATWKERTDYQYKCEYYFEALDGSYVKDDSKTTTKTGAANHVVTAEVLTVTGFTYDSSKSIAGTINKDGSLVIKTYYTRNSYKLSYYVDNVLYNEANHKFGETITMLAAPTKEGEEFTGWSQNLTTMPAYDTVINGSFVAAEYEITYVLNGGQFNEDYKTIDELINGFQTDYSSVNGNTLTAYASAENDKIKAFFSNTEMFAKWNWLLSAIEDLPRVGSSRSSYYEAILNDPTGTSGYADGVVMQDLVAFVTKKTTGGPMYSANYVAFDATNLASVFNAMVSVGKSIQTHFNGGETAILVNPVRSGYKFVGWYDNESFNGNIITSVNRATTLYAKWVSNSVDVYTANMVMQNNGNTTTSSSVLDSNGFTITSATFTSSFVVFQVYKNGAAVNMAPSLWTWTSSDSNVIANYSNYSCTGSVKGEGKTTITLTNVADPTISVSFIATVVKAVVKHSVTLNLNYGTCANLTEYVEGTTTTLPIPTRAGYVFEGWYETSDFTGSAVVAISDTENTNKEYFAKWSYNETTPSIEALIPDVIYGTINLPSVVGDYDITWSSSNTSLVSFTSGDILTLHKGKQTHQLQDITITMQTTKGGVTQTYTKNCKVGPVVFDDLVSPVAAYVNSSAMYHYVAYDGKDDIFSDKAKAVLDIAYYNPININADGSLQAVSSSFTKYVNDVLALRETGTRVSFSVFGSEAAFSEATANHCDTLAQNLVDFVVRYGADGIDLDWEFTRSNADGANYTKLMRLLREKFDAIQAAGGSPYIITAAIPASNFTDKYYDFPGMNTYCDYVNMMSYDLFNSSKATHQSALYTSSNDGGFGLGVDWGVKEFTSKGLAKSKIIVGCACYGKAWKLTGTSTSTKYPGLGVAGTLFNAGVTGSHDSGTQYYYGIQELINTGRYKTYTEYNNNGQLVCSYLYSETDKVFITYETAEVFQAKYEYALAGGMGIMCWSMPEDARDTYINTLYNCRFGN